MAIGSRWRIEGSRSGGYGSMKREVSGGRHNWAQRQGHKSDQSPRCRSGTAKSLRAMTVLPLLMRNHSPTNWSASPSIGSFATASLQRLVADALQMSVWRGRPPDGQMILHSDRGSQVTSWAFGRRIRLAGLVGSMGSVAPDPRCARSG